MEDMVGSRLLSDQSGFGLVEVLIAASVMLVGMLGVGVMLDHAAVATYTAKSRVQGMSVQREVIEAARSIPYDQLTPASVVPRVQEARAAGLSDGGAEPGWTVRRAGFTYTITLGVCSVDDPADGTGAHDPAMFCASGAGQTTPEQCRDLLGTTGSVQGGPASGTAGASVGDCGLDLDLDGRVDNLVEATGGVCVTGACAPSQVLDRDPEDYKRIVSLVRWDRGTGRRYALQTTTVPNPGLSAAPSVLSLAPTTPATVTSGTSVAFSATTNREPATVAWYVDGTHKGAASGAQTAWGFTWDIGSVSAGATPQAGEVLDGSYVVGAKAFDAFGAAGHMRAVTVRLNRRAPYAPVRFEAGRNGGQADFEWSASPERDIEGYRVFRRPASGAPVAVCALTRRTSCHDAAPPDDASVDYYVVAVDRDPAGALREGSPSAIDSATRANTAPYAPENLTASASNGNTVLLWSASPGDPDEGDGVDHYRIYRDGVAYADRYDRTSTGSELSFTDTRTGGVAHDYWVVAVDRNLAESQRLGPVRR